MSYTKSFFERLNFDPALHDTWIGRYFSRIRLLLLITVTLALAGGVMFAVLDKELNPDIQIPTVIVSTVYPGAGPGDIESLITIPVEDAVSGLSDVTRVSSNSQESFSTVVVEFSSTVDPEKAKEEVQNAVDKVNDLPERAEDPAVEVIDFTNQPVMLLAVSLPEHPELLPEAVDTLREQLRELPGVERATLTYRRDPEVSVTVTPERLLQYELSLTSLARTLAGTLENAPAGTIASQGTVLSIGQEEPALSLESLRALPIMIGDSLLPLDTLATISETEKPGTVPASIIERTGEPTRAIFLALYQTESADTQETVQSIQTVLENFRADSGLALRYATYFDGAYEINKSFDQLEHDFAVTFGLVFFVLLVFFGLRQSVVAALAIPFTFLVTFIVMGLVGISINFISLFSLLLALGILVDNAIVVISALASYYRSGKFTAMEAALLVFRDFKEVIFTTTITTVWAFLPLLLSTGIIGEFIQPIPIVVSSALAISAVVALFIVVPFMAFFLGGSIPERVRRFGRFALFALIAVLLWLVLPAGPAKTVLYLLALVLLILLFRLARSFFRTVTAWEHTRLAHFLHEVKDNGLLNFDRLSLLYSRVLERILSSRRARIRTMVFLVIFMVFSYTLVPLGYVVNEFFPNDDVDVVYVSAELPTGTTAAEGQAVLGGLMPRFQSFPEINFVLGEVGATSPVDTVASTTGQEFNRLLMTVHLVPKGERERTSTELVSALEAAFASWNGGKLSVSQLSGGPPAGSDLQLKLLGQDLATLEALAAKTKRYIEELPGTNNVSVSISSEGKKLAFQPDDAKLSALGLSGADTATLLRALGSGATVKEDARFGEDKRDLVIRLKSEGWSTPDDLGRLLVATPSGALVPLTALGTVTLERNPTLITREDEKRSISISAGVSDGYSVTELNQKIEAFADGELGLPEDYSWKTGGVNEENNKSVQSIMYAMLLSALLIFGTMVVQFNSFRKALIVLLVIPIAVSGVFIFFALFGIPLSFPALIGILALFGIVVNNSIIMVDKINKNLDLGLSVREAVVEGATSRLEPILLTALSTIIGLIPITLSDPIWMGLGGAIIAGLTFSGVAKLFFIPVIYEMWFDDKPDPVEAKPLTDDYRQSFHTTA